MNERSIRDFHGEVAMLKTLCHPNIVQFIGACCDPICLVTEYCHKGNLFDVLQNAPSSLEWSLVLKLATDAARGCPCTRRFDTTLKLCVNIFYESFLSLSA